MLICDDVLPDPLAYRQAVLARPFRDVTITPDLCFHGIQIATDPTFPDWIVRQCPQLTPTMSFFRQSPVGQVEPHYVHTDRDMGDWTAILYLTPHPPPSDGTMFWRHRATHALGSVTKDDAALLDEQLAWDDINQWEPIDHVRAKCGRALVFSAERFHSRAIPENYGAGREARLVQVVFGIGAL